MSARAAFAGAFVAVLALALLVGPLRRLAGEGESGRAPDFDVPVSVAETPFEDVPAGATYVVEASDRTPLEQGNLKAIGQLYLAHALPVHDAARAQWSLSLRGGDVTLRRR